MNRATHSSDKYPIEHVWDHLRRAIPDWENTPITLQDLATAVQVDCDNEVKHFIDNFIHGMPRRVGRINERRDDLIDY